MATRPARTQARTTQKPSTAKPKPKPSKPGSVKKKAAKSPRQAAAREPFDIEEMTERWDRRDDEMHALIEKLGASHMPFRIDLSVGRFWLQSPDGRPKVVASTKLLLSYSHTARSIVCGWASPNVPKAGIIAPVAGIDDSFEERSEGFARGLAMHLADRVGAHFFFGLPGEPATIFLALWDVRAAAEGDAPFVLRPPWPHVEDVLKGLIARIKEGTSVDDLLKAFGKTFETDETRQGTEFEAPLREVGAQLSGLAGLSPAKQKTALGKLLKEVELKQAA